MKRAAYPAAIQGLISELKRLPGIGPRSAERIALWMIQSRDARPLEIARAIREVHEGAGRPEFIGLERTEVDPAAGGIRNARYRIAEELRHAAKTKRD